MLLAADLKNLQHMLNAVAGRHPKEKWGTRNHFIAGKGSQIESMRRLEQAGLVREGEKSTAITYFHATVEGCRHAGLEEVHIQVAMESQRKY